MESETARIDTEAPDGTSGLPPFFLSLQGRIDARALSKLARLGEDYTETTVTLRTLEGAKEVDRFGPVNLSNFEPDFLQAAADTAGGGRVSVELLAPGKKPWRFLLDLPEPETEVAAPAAVAAPAPGADLLARLAESQVALQQSVNALASSVATMQLRAQEPNEDIEFRDAMREARREVMQTVLATIKGEDPRGRMRIKEYIGEFRELVKDVSGMKSDLAAAAVEMGAGPAAPDVDPIEQAEKAMSAVDRFTQTGIGAAIKNKLFPADAPADQKKLEGPEAAAEVSAAYG